MWGTLKTPAGKSFCDVMKDYDRNNRYQSVAIVFLSAVHLL
jgi:hypothetical protein